MPPVTLKSIKPSNVKNILIVRQHNQLGDMLCSVPLFEALRNRFPSAHITLVASPINYEILFSDINPYIDEVIVYNKKTFRSLSSFYKTLRTRKYDIGIVPSTVSISRTSHLINYLSGAKIRVGVKSIDGKPNKVEYLLNVKSDFEWDKKKLHQIERNLDIGRQIGCDLPEEERRIKLRLHEDEICFGQNLILNEFPDNTKPVIAFHPGAGKIANRWDTDNFIKLITKLYEKYHNHILITSGKIDTEITENVSKELIKKGIEHYIIFNTAVRKVAAAIKYSDLYITNDTGTMHVAAGVDANIVSLFGQTHGFEWAPSGKNKIYIQSRSGNINDITVDEVFEASSGIINSVLKEKNNYHAQNA